MFRAIPVAIVEGQPTVSPAYLAGIFEEMKRQDKVRYAFYDGSVFDEQSWFQFLFQNGNLPVLVVDLKDRCQFFAWLNSFDNIGSARVHFCFLGDRYDRRIHKVVKAYWETFRDDDGEPLFRTLIGLTPESFTDALRLSKIIGFTPVGTIPGICEMSYEGARREGGVITYLELHKGG